MFLLTASSRVKLSARHYFLVATASWFAAFGMQNVVFAWLVTIVLREPADLVGWAQTAILAPGMVLILIAGAIADRLGPDRLALWAQAFAVLVPWLLIVPLSLGHLSYGLLIVYALMMGCAQAFVTPARDGLLNHVAEGQVQRMVMWASLSQFGFQIVGYVVAGFAQGVGAPVILTIQSVLLVVGVVAFWLIRRMGAAKVEHEGARDGVLRNISVGAKTVMASPVMRIIVLQNVAMALFFMGAFIVAFPLVVREVFDGSSADLAILNGVNSIGLVLTIVVLLRIGPLVRSGRALLLAQVIGGVALLLVGLMQSFPLFVALAFVWGLCGGMAMPMSRSLMQELAPPEQRARVMSFYAVSFMGAGPLGTVFVGYLSDAIGPQNAIALCGSAMLLVSLLVGIFSQLWRTRSVGVTA